MQTTASEAGDCTVRRHDERPRRRRLPETFCLGIGLAVVLCDGAGSFGQQTPDSLAQARSIMHSTPPGILVESVVHNELNAHDRGHFMFCDSRQTPEGTKTKEIIETADGAVARLLAVNDQPLTAQQRAEDDSRLQSLLQHPDLQKQKRKEQQQDEERVRHMFEELPKAFIYQYAGAEPGNPNEPGAVIRLAFTPNPAYSPPSHETAVYKAMSGQIWLAVPEERLARIEATLFRSVNFGWGILGHLDQGGHFFVAQSKIGAERWDVTYMNIQFTGKALLFKSINLHEVEKLSDFRPVPDGLTLAEGVKLLEKNSGQVAQNASGK
jgi:hypothetical protein